MRHFHVVTLAAALLIPACSPPNDCSDAGEVCHNDQDVTGVCESGQLPEPDGGQDTLTDAGLVCCVGGTMAFSSLDAWEEYMADKPIPDAGCFDAVYPCITWQQVKCTTAPPFPL